jgi:hypothetical protein
MGSRDTKTNTRSKTGSRTEKHGEHSNVSFACQKDSSHWYPGRLQIIYGLENSDCCSAASCRPPVAAEKSLLLRKWQP